MRGSTPPRTRRSLRSLLPLRSTLPSNAGLIDPRCSCTGPPIRMRQRNAFTPRWTHRPSSIVASATSRSPPLLPRSIRTTIARSPRSMQPAPEYADPHTSVPHFHAHMLRTPSRYSYEPHFTGTTLTIIPRNNSDRLPVGPAELANRCEAPGDYRPTAIVHADNPAGFACLLAAPTTRTGTTLTIVPRNKVDRLPVGPAELANRFEAPGYHRPVATASADNPADPSTRRSPALLP